MSMIGSIRRQLTPSIRKSYIFIAGLCPRHPSPWLVFWLALPLDWRDRDRLVRYFFRDPVRLTPLDGVW